MTLDRPSWVDFRAVKQAVNLEAVLRYYQIPALRRRGDRLEGPCPLHRGEREDSFRVHLRRNVFHCFACEAQGNVLDFVAALEECSIREAALRLQQRFGVAAPADPVGLPAVDGERDKRQLVRKKEGYNAPLRFALTGVQHAHPYLARRGIDAATAAEFGIGFYAGPGLLRGRIVIPIRNARGQIVAYAGRALDGGLPKYKLPVGFRKGWELFNLPRAVATGSQTVILVEGYFDCMRVHQAGFPCVVALMGSSLSEAQQSILQRHFEQVLLMLDGDPAGRAASEAIAVRLSGRCNLPVIRVPDGTQPDHLSDSAIRRLLAEREEIAFATPPIPIPHTGCQNGGGVVKR
jgi:DNA primase